jgi:hypothetical protein
LHAREPHANPPFLFSRDEPFIWHFHGHLQIIRVD